MQYLYLYFSFPKAYFKRQLGVETGTYTTKIAFIPISPTYLPSYLAYYLQNL